MVMISHASASELEACRLTHHCTETHHPNGHYYASVFDRRSNAGDGRIALLAGPFPTHGQALDILPAAKAEAERIDPRATWYAFGTLCMKDGYKKPGILNDRLGLSSETQRVADGSRTTRLSPVSSK